MPPLPPLRRRLFNLAFNHLGGVAAAVSLVLCVATAALWVRSEQPLGVIRGRESVETQRARTDWFVAADGRLCWSMSVNDPPVERITRSRTSYLRYRQIPRHRPYVWLKLDRGDWAVLGMKVESGSSENYRWFGIEVPCWILIVAFAMVPLVRMGFAYRTNRRIRTGLCPTCGYDLRATPARCPECGTASTVTS